MAKQEKIENIQYFTQTDILNRGWTKALINKFLPEPKLVRNPRYKCAAPMKLWEQSVVENIELQPDFISAMLKSEQRKNSAKKAITTKIDNKKSQMIAIANSIRITVLDDDILRKRALNAKQDWYNLNSENYDYPKTVNDADEETIERWVVNYIRHELVAYDDILGINKGKIGLHEAYPNFKYAILKRIAETYPKYINECKNQMELCYISET